VGGDFLDEGNVSGADEATSGNILDPTARTVIIVADEHTTMRLRGNLCRAERN
jgi:hypothetical protein